MGDSEGDDEGMAVGANEGCLLILGALEGDGVGSALILGETDG